MYLLQPDILYNWMRQPPNTVDDHLVHLLMHSYHNWSLYHQRNNTPQNIVNMFDHQQLNPALQTTLLQSLRWCYMHLHLTHCDAIPQKHNKYLLMCHFYSRNTHYMLLM